MALPTYPEMLTNRDWQKQKGAIAKVAGETGIGAQMDKVKALWDKVAWAKFDAEKLCQGMKSLDVWEKAFAEAKKEYPKVEPVKKELWALRDLAKATADKWKANKLIPKASREHVENIAKTADVLSVALKSLDQDFLDVKKKWEEAQFDPEKIQKRLTEAAAKQKDLLEKTTAEELKRESSQNWFGRDFLRFLDGYRIRTDGKVVRERQSGMDAKATLAKLVEAMGSKWKVPEGKEYYDPQKASSGPLEKLVGETLKKEDELYKVMSLMSQKGIAQPVAPSFRDATGIKPELRFMARTATADRWKETDRWSIDVDITAASVKVTHFVSLCEGHDSPHKFKVRFIVERTLDRKTGAVKCAPPKAELVIE
jgi:hypothetical protein